jgi:hypothetical protein
MDALSPDEDAVLRPGRMHVVEGRLQIGGEGYRDFIIQGRSVPEVFSARLMNGSTTLEVTWAESLGQGVLANRLAQVQELAGGPGSFTRVTGQATSEFRDLIQVNRFDLDKAGQALGQRLGGKWRVELRPRPNSTPPTWDIVAIRIGD